MPRVCTVCQAPDRNAIDRELVAVAAPLRDIAERHRLSTTAVHRHVEHISRDVLEAFEAAEEERRDDILDTVTDLVGAARRILGEAEAAGDRKGALDAIRTAGTTLTLLAKLVGRLDERPQVNVAVVTTPSWRRLEADLLEVLDRYPDARQAVTARLLELEAGDG